jgi:hypothetical protein
VQLRPSMKPASLLKTGADDLAAAEVEREAAARRREEEAEKERLAKAAAEEAVEKEKAKAAALLALKEQEMAWQRSMGSLKVAAARRKEVAVENELARERQRVKLLRWQDATDAEGKRRAEKELSEAQAVVDAAEAAQRAAEGKALAAMESEKQALAEVMATQSKLNLVSVRMAANYGSAQFAKGLARAREAASLRKGMDSGGAKYEAWNASITEKMLASSRAEKASPKGSDEEILVELVAQLKAATGPQETWQTTKPAELAKQAVAGGVCADRIAELCSNKAKNRKAAVDAGVFVELQQFMAKFESGTANERLDVQLRCTRAIEALTKKAEKEGHQEAGDTVIWALSMGLWQTLKPTTETLASLAQPGINALKNLTRNHRENTLKLVRSRGLLDWLDEDSTIMPPKDMRRSLG